MDQPNGRRPTGSRCIALVGPYLSGKTTLLEAILFQTGAIQRQGKVSEKSTVGDAAPEARAHGMSVELNTATTSYLGDSYTFIDCPGSIEFAQDARAALPGCDVAVVVCEADDKKAPALQLILKQLDEIGLPRILFINKVDKTDSSPRDVLSWLQPASSKPLIMRQLPIMKGTIVTGFVDLALERAYVYQEHLESKLIDMPEDLAALEKSERFAMLEKLADHDDELMEQLLADMEPPRDRVFGDLARELAEGLITPVLFGSAEHGTGIERLLKALRHEAPVSPIRRSGWASSPTAPWPRCSRPSTRRMAESCRWPASFPVRSQTAWCCTAHLGRMAAWRVCSASWAPHLRNSPRRRRATRWRWAVSTACAPAKRFPPPRGTRRSW